MRYPWLESSWTTLKNHYQQRRLPHALIITGIKGLGKRYLGEKLAQLILCEMNVSEPCGTCRQCHLFEVQSHPDYKVVEPEESSKTIKIEQIRELIDTLNQTPLVATSQVVLINPLESLTLKAANALLKTLEEPLGSVFFILIAHRLTHIPMTLLSRCQVYPIHAYQNEQTLQWLSEALSCTQSEARVLLRFSHGAPLEALALSKKNIISKRDQLLRIMSYRITGHNPLPDIDVLLKENSDDVFSIMKLIFSDLRKCQLRVDADKWVNSDAMKQVQQLSAAIMPDQLQLQWDVLERAEKALSAGVAINQQMVLEGIIFKEIT